MLKLRLCDNNDVYILTKGTISVVNTGAVDANTNDTNIELICKNRVPFKVCIIEINNTQADNAQDIDIMMPIYNLLEYKNNYSKTLGRLIQYYRDEPTSNNDGIIVHLPDNNTTNPIKFKQKIKIQVGNYGITNVEMMAPLKYLSNFWRNFEMPLINSEVNRALC